MLTLVVSKDVQAVGIAFNLINIRAAHLKNEEQEKAEVATSPGSRIIFANGSVPSYELTSTFANSRQTEKKSRAISDDSHSSA